MKSLFINPAFYTDTDLTQQLISPKEMVPKNEYDILSSVVANHCPDITFDALHIVKNDDGKITIYGCLFGAPEIAVCVVPTLDVTVPKTIELLEASEEIIAIESDTRIDMIDDKPLHSVSKISDGRVHPLFQSIIDKIFPPIE